MFIFFIPNKNRKWQKYSNFGFAVEDICGSTIHNTGEQIGVFSAVSA
jgi:hypothetical protein